jgi:hypothetical protein
VLGWKKPAATTYEGTHMIAAINARKSTLWRAPTSPSTASAIGTRLAWWQSELLLRVPADPGVYVIRWQTPHPRVRGASELVYIGSAINAQGLRMRLRQYFHPGHLQKTNLRIQELVGVSTDYEVSFAVCPSAGSARPLEADLLARYEDDHGELPPQNRRRWHRDKRKTGGS